MSKADRDWVVILYEEQHPRYVNGQEIPNWQQGLTLWDVVNYLGLKGWLLLSYDMSASQPGYGKLILMRQK